MVTTRGGDACFGSGSSSGSKSMDERICEFITSEIICSIIEPTLMIFSTIKDRIVELLDECSGAFWAEIIARELGVRTISFRKFKACGSPEFFWAMASR